jgi:3-dehydroquinate dehydratase/shikimate dehydrogenase
MTRSNFARVCVPICALDADQVESGITLAARVADMVEVRLDCVSREGLAGAVERISRFIAKNDCPLILTFRPAEQGGHREISVAERIEFWSGLCLGLIREMPKAAIFLDIEGGLLRNPEYRSLWNELGWNRIICSYHDFSGDTQDLDNIYEQLAETPARVLKIAVHAREASDTIPVFKILQRARKSGRDIIAISMGEGGVATRILGPSRGSFLTFASLHGGKATAPGQVTVASIRDVFNVARIGPATKIAGLIGSPVVHSVSPEIHNAAFQHHAVDAVYLPFEVKNLGAFMRRCVRPESREIDWDPLGFSVTAPHKTAVIPYLDWVDPLAMNIGAVNTVTFKDNALHGYNTDVFGFLAPLTSRGILSRGMRVAVLGAGGAARGAISGLQKQGVAVSLFARDTAKARRLGDEFGIDVRALGGDLGDFDVVVNATPLGMSGALENESPLRADQLKGVKLVYDLVYNPLLTKLMIEAQDAGCEVVGGLEMLLAQAAEQFRLWTGLEVESEVMSRAALNRLTARVEIY